jgi:hypothetical protein
VAELALGLPDIVDQFFEMGPVTPIISSEPTHFPVINIEEEGTAGESFFKQGNAEATGFEFHRIEKIAIDVGQEAGDRLSSLP